MGSEEKDPIKALGNWNTVSDQPSTDGNVKVKKRLPKKLRQIPEYYFLPRRSWQYNLAFYGGCIAAGIGTGMLIEIWINKKVKDDGGVIWESK